MVLFLKRFDANQRDVRFKKFFPQDRVVNISTHRSYNCIVPPGATYINDYMSNVIYLITCDKCKLQYVGGACHKLNNNFNCHNSCFRHPKKYCFCRIFNEHFQKRVFKNSSYSVTITEKLKGTDRTDRNGMDKLFQPLRKARKRFWMMELRIMYLYGLNYRYDENKKKMLSLPKKHAN